METFEQDIIELLGDRIRKDDAFAKTVYQALTNTEWINWDGDKYFTSFRGAGSFLAEIVCTGSYMDWYCCAPEGKVSDEIANAMAERGWKSELPKI